MFKKADFILIGLVLVVATATYIVKYGAEIEYNNITSLEREIGAEKEAIDILRANWSLLTDPSRIQSLAEQHQEELNLEILQSKQIINIDQIPLKPLKEPDYNSAEIDDKGVDHPGIITGSVKKKGGKR